ncbi:SLC13 family permease [Peptoniphilus sp. SGI.035]|uniref:SLC13 family permease n=1 Tax=Peptoniphilus sp. SGI.035 TaxID=3420564 RepID=UPI003D02ED40
MTTKGIIAIVIFIIAVILLISKKFHPVLIGASIPTALALFGVLDPKTAFSDFANTTVVFFMSLLVVGGAIFNTGLADFLGEKIIGLIGRSEKGVVLGTSFVSILLSSFLNDTGTTGCLMPIAGAMGKKSGVKLSKIYMALAFAASMGGTVTLIGGGSHIVAQGFLEDAGIRGFSFFEFTPIGLPIAIAGLIYIYFYGVNKLPNKDVNEEAQNIQLAEKDPIKMTIVALIFVGIVICMATKIIPMHLAAALGAILVVLTGCISTEDAVKQFSVSTLFLVAGIFPLSKALSETGAAEFLISKMSGSLSTLPPIIIVAFVLGIAVIGTQFMMGTSLTAILCPIAILIAESTNIDPRALVMCVAIGTSGAFCTPFGTGPNLLVWEAGGYEFKDYFRVGFPYTIIFFLIGTVTIYLQYLA